MFLLENVSGHGSPECLLQLSLVKVNSFPANTTLHFQSRDACTLSTLKRRYRIVRTTKFQMEMTGIKTSTIFIGLLQQAMCIHNG